MNELITHLNILCKGEIIMSKKSKTAGLEQFKMEAAREVGVTLGQGYNGELTAKQAGSVGGQMVKKMLPVRNKSYIRNNRNVEGHRQEVTYQVKVTY